MILLKLIIAAALLLFFFWFASQGIEPLDPELIEQPPTAECMRRCVWEAQHWVFMNDKGPITKQRFNKITAACTEECNRSYDESFGSSLDD